MSPLSGLQRYILAAVSVAAATLLIAWGIQTRRLDSAQEKAASAAEAARQWHVAADAWQSAASAIDADRNRFRGIVNRQGEALSDAKTQTDLASADARTARSALDRLLDRAAVARASPCRCDPGASASASAAGSPAGTAADLSPDVLSRMGEAAGQLAAYADAARAAGQLCERDYDALRADQ